MLTEYIYICKLLIGNCAALPPATGTHPDLTPVVFCLSLWQDNMGFEINNKYYSCYSSWLGITEASYIVWKNTDSIIIALLGSSNVVRHFCVVCRNERKQTLQRPLHYCIACEQYRRLLLPRLLINNIATLVIL